MTRFLMFKCKCWFSHLALHLSSYLLSRKECLKKVINDYDIWKKKPFFLSTQQGRHFRWVSSANLRGAGKVYKYETKTVYFWRMSPYMFSLFKVKLFKVLVFYSFPSLLNRVLMDQWDEKQLADSCFQSCEWFKHEC